MNIDITSMDIAQIILAATPVLVTLIILRERIKSKKGTGKRTIQILTIAIVVPILGLLTINDRLEDATLGTLLGALLGYTLSDLSKGNQDESSNTRESTNTHK